MASSGLDDGPEDTNRGYKDKTFALIRILILLRLRLMGTSINPTQSGS